MGAFELPAAGELVGPLDQGPVANQPRPSRAHAVIAGPQAVVTSGFDWPHAWHRAPLQRPEFLQRFSNIAHLHVRRRAAGVSETRSPSGDRQSSRDASRRSRSQCVAAIPVGFDRPAWHGDSGSCPGFLSFPLKCGLARHRSQAVQFTTWCGSGRESRRSAILRGGSSSRGIADDDGRPPTCRDCQAPEARQRLP
jgi:hypothetical protein